MYTLSQRSPSSMGRRSVSLLLSIIMIASLAAAAISSPDDAHAVVPASSQSALTVPDPSPPASDYEIGAIAWPLWKQGTHFGWDLVEPYAAERKPLGVGWYDENDPEVWGWFNRWALNYGIKFWVLGWFRGENGPINNDTDGRHIFDAFKASQFSDQMKYAVDIHNYVGATAAEIENNIYPYLKTQFLDSRYLVKDNKPVVYLIEDADFDIAKLRALAIADGWSGVTVLERYGAGDADGKVVYNDIIDAGGGWGNGYGMATISQGWSPEPWSNPPGGLQGQGFRTVPEFQTKLQEAKAWMDTQPVGTLRKTMALIGTWNEIAEGHYVLPSPLAGFGYLDAVRQTFTSGGSLPSDTLPASPIQNRFDNFGAHWELDESSGDVVNDSSVFGHHAAKSGGTWVPGGGFIGGALSLDGVDDYVQLKGPGTDSEAFLNERFNTRNVSLRFKADTTSGQQILYEEGGVADGLAIRLNNSQLEAAIAGDGGTSILSTAFTDTTSWHEVQVLYSTLDYGVSGQIAWRELIIDGTSYDSESASSGPDVRPGPHLGQAALGIRLDEDAFGTVGDGDYFDGMIDDVRISYRPRPPGGGGGGGPVVNNPGFESGSLSPWFNTDPFWGTSSVTTGAARTGSYGVEVTGEFASAEQLVTGLSPSTTYTLSGYARVVGGGTARIGVYQFDGGAGQVDSLQVSSTAYDQQLFVQFTTGASDTSVRVYCWRDTGASGSAQCDDLWLTQN